MAASTAPNRKAVDAGGRCAPRPKGMIDVEHWLRVGGLAALAIIVFAESGLLVGFFLPADTLLFVAGFLSSAPGGPVLPPLPITAAVVFLAAAAGDQVGYLIGRRVGPALFSRLQSRLFNPASWFVDYLRSRPMTIFGWYRLVAAAVTLVLVTANRI